MKWNDIHLTVFILLILWRRYTFIVCFQTCTYTRMRQWNSSVSSYIVVPKSYNFRMSHLRSKVTNCLGFPIFYTLYATSPFLRQGQGQNKKNSQKSKMQVAFQTLSVQQADTCRCCLQVLYVSCLDMLQSSGLLASIKMQCVWKNACNCRLLHVGQL
jgi:hypothetical protein